MDFVRLSLGESLEGKLKEIKQTKNKKGEDRTWYFFDVDGQEKILSSNAGTLKKNIAEYKVGDKLLISYESSNGKSFYNVSLV